MKKFLMGMALCVAATSGLHAQDTTFDGTLDCNGNRYMSIPQSDAFNVAAGTGEITVTARVWIRGDYYGKARGIICSRWHEKRPGGLTGNNLWYKHGSGFDIHGGESTEHCFSNNVTVDGSYYYNTSSLYHLGTLSHSYENTAGKLSTGTWAHIAWTFKSNGGTSVLYINGIEVESVNTGAYKSASPDGKAITNRSAILVGGRYCWKQGVGSYETRVDNDAIWDGKIDDVRFYGKALSADDIKKDKESGFPLAGFDLIAAYDFEHIVDNKVADISGNGHNADLVVVKGDQFPAATKQHTLTAIAPDVEGASLRLVCSSNGQVPAGGEIAKGDSNLSYVVSNQADYHLTYSVDGVDPEKYKFMGLYVNGEPTDNVSGFHKAGNDATAELRFREIQTSLDGIDTDMTAPAEFFTLQGVAVDGTVLTPGIYIMRRGTTVAKVLVK